jgi:hypothetical protein
MYCDATQSDANRNRLLPLIQIRRAHAFVLLTLSIVASILHNSGAVCSTGAYSLFMEADFVIPS